MCYATAICTTTPCTWDQGITKILTFPSANLRYVEAPGNGLRPSTRVYLRLPLVWWTQSLTYPRHCRHRQKTIYATAFTGPMGPMLQMKAALTQIRIEYMPNWYLVWTASIPLYHSNRKYYSHQMQRPGFICITFGYRRDHSFTVGGQTDRRRDRELTL